MARPKLICSHEDGETILEVCEADAVYAVLYRGQPIAIRRHNPNLKYLGYKYAKSMFPSSGHAFGLAKRLNEAHNTTDFTVAIMGISKTISQ